MTLCRRSPYAFFLYYKRCDQEQIISLQLDMTCLSLTYDNDDVEYRLLHYIVDNIDERIKSFEMHSAGIKSKARCMGNSSKLVY